MTEVYNVSGIYEEINGYAGVCVPLLDSDNNWILAQDSLDDPLLEPIWPKIAACPLIPYKPKQ